MTFKCLFCEKTVEGDSVPSDWIKSDGRPGFFSSASDAGYFCCEYCAREYEKEKRKKSMKKFFFCLYYFVSFAIIGYSLGVYLGGLSTILSIISAIGAVISSYSGYIDKLWSKHPIGKYIMPICFVVIVCCLAAEQYSNREAVNSAIEFMFNSANNMPKY